MRLEVGRGRGRGRRWEVGMVRDEKVGMELRKGRWGDERGGEG